MLRRRRRQASAVSVFRGYETGAVLRKRHSAPGAACLPPASHGMVWAEGVQRRAVGGGQGEGK